MAQQRLRDTFTQLVQSARRFSLSRDSFFWLWRSGALGRPATQEGFILPTVTLLLLILSLVVGLLIFRTFNRTEQVSGERKQKVIYNYATPAIDRAKAKIEYLFTAEALALPPSDDSLTNLLKKETYDFPGETRLNLDDNATTIDPGWTYQADIDGDGRPETVAYSLLTAANSIRTDANGAITLGDSIDSPVSFAKARSLVTRNGPINLLGSASGVECQNVTTVKEKAWQDIGKVLRKALQVNAVVIGSSNGGQVPVATLEMQQDREAPKSPKWGAWFRTDLELNPGPTFRWNGAMHTEGSYFLGSKNSDGASLTLHLISSPKSCVFDKEASTLTNRKQDVKNPAYTHLGHMVYGSIRDNSYPGGDDLGPVQIVPQSDNPATLSATGNWMQLRADTDSITQGGGKPQSIALDPIVLYNEDRSVTENDVAAAAAPDNMSVLSAAKPGLSDRISKDRIETDTQPYVDDTFRADNRFGPRPTYKSVDGTELLNLKLATNDLGDPIVLGDPIAGDTSAGTTPATTVNGIELTREDPTVESGSGTSLRKADPYDETSYGYDGYWERRAKKQGVRVIVGQRLELGNTFGWNGTAGPVAGDDSEPLYPPTKLATATNDVPPVPTGAFATRRHEQKQLRTLRDNLAAVQATAVYHYRGNKGEFPVACLATTAHPGTPATIRNSTTFKTVRLGTFDAVRTDFLKGSGTNGWEFPPPGGGDEASFKTALAADLGNALTNLARFAGDPKGGLPSYKAVANTPGRIYPDPIQTMWGDFSMLRRVIDGGGLSNYDSLSPADKSTLHTAACTVQMLAYNIRYVAEGDRLGPLKDNGDLGILAQAIQTVTGPSSDADPNFMSDAENGVKQRAYAWIKANNPGRLDSIKAAVEKTVDYIQVQRDRRYGFLKNNSTTATDTAYRPNGRVTYNTFNGTDWTTVTARARGQVKFAFNPTEAGFFGLGSSAEIQANTQLEQQFVVIANALSGSGPSGSGSGLSPKYPALFYIFPVESHDVNGAPVNVQPPEEDYIANATARTDLNSGLTFSPVNLLNIVNTASATGRGMPRSTTSDWVTPVEPIPAADATTPACVAGKPCNVVVYQPPKPNPTDPLPNPQYLRTAFLDKVIYSGREAMAVRLLDLDLDLLRRNRLGGTTDKRDGWLPLPNFAQDPAYQTKTGALIYAFREDAVREDTIQRPSANLTPIANLTAYLPPSGFVTTYLMNAVGSTPNDPPRNSELISPKSVDFFADPDRRPYGFRLRNGADIRRLGNADTASDKGDAMRGLSVVSDNPVYIQGDFNLHSQTEFTGQTKPIDPATTTTYWNEFYTRTALNPNFACEKYADNTLSSNTSCSVGDTWRPVEVISDSITLLSASFLDGSVAEGLLTDRTSAGLGPDSGSNTRNSFMAATVPLQTDKAAANMKWTLENTGATFTTNPSSVFTSSSSCETDGMEKPTPNSPIVPCVPVRVTRDNYFFAEGAVTGATEIGKAVGQQSKSSVPIKFFAITNKNADGSDAGDGVEVGNASTTEYKGIKNWLGKATPTEYNLTFVSGITPSRVDNYNGGLHNFPRQAENWLNVPLTFSGAMVQLTFSNYSTSPYEFDSWEPGAVGISGVSSFGQPIPYYQAPDRQFGYDVALQYAPPGPVSQRFLGPRKTRSEFYRDLPVDDPYVRLLRCAKPVSGSTNAIDPTAAANGECTP
jgi:hypothetical protein